MNTSFFNSFRARILAGGATFLAVLVLGLTLSLPGGLLQAQEAAQFFTYTENSADPVGTFTSSDPEGATPGYWSLVQSENFTAIDVNGNGDTTDDVDIVAADVADENLFKIDQNGVLSFKKPRSYEDNSASGNKEHRVTVQVSDGSEVQYFEAYVTVTDLEETGKVTWIVGPDGSATAGTDISLQEFQPGAQLLASVTDPDSVVPDTNNAGSITSTGVTWKWYRGSSAISGATDATYAVMSADVGHHIRVEATYSDGSGPSETVSFTSPHPVQAYRRAADNSVPSFSPTTVTRRVEENSKGDVGGPVTATDSDGDILTYTLGAADDNLLFNIDPATGQLTVKASTEIDYEDATNTDRSYTVTVTATDSSGNTTDPATTHTPATVTINVINVDEKPTFDAAASTAAGVIMAQTEGRKAIDLNNDTDTDATDVATFVASDPEGEKVTLSLMGNDAGSFELADDADTGNGVSQILSFKEKTDFEMPGDQNQDNVYEVTVRASDGTLNADRMLIIKVINDDTEGGKVTVSPADAVVGVELTASLAHMEGDVSASGQITNLKWQWQKADPAGTPATCTDATVSWPAVDADPPADPASPGNIANATKAAYTPASVDADDCLRATATYNYQFAASTVNASSGGTEVLVSQANQAPKFKEGASTFRVVAENVAAVTADNALGNDAEDAADNVGSPIGATDANGDTVTYTLGGSSASLFRVRSNGQLEVKGKLDHEKSSSHTVTLTANDGSGASNDSATITVTIYVTDVDEKPKIMVGGLVITGPDSRDYMENATSTVATYSLTGPNAATATWSLSGDDAGAFSISNAGELTFAAAPDFEAAADANTDNTYEVTVEADDGTFSDMHDVTVKVTNVAEAPKFNEGATATRSVAENTAAGENIGDPVEATADTGTTIASYALGGTDADSFALATSTGQLMTSAALDFETKDSYSVTVTATDSAGKYAMITVTIMVTDVEEGLMGRYDANKDGEIDKSEAIEAINDYLFGEGDDAISKADAIEVINLYLFGSN